MTSEQRKARIKTLLDRYRDPLLFRDWYFADCPEEQRRACFYYEYLREAQREGRINLIDWRKGINYDPFTEEYDAKKVKQWFPAGRRLTRRIERPLGANDFAQSLIRTPWPTKPWLDLERDERTRRTKDFRPFVRINFRQSGSRLSSRELANIWPPRPQPWEVWGAVCFHKGIRFEELDEILREELKRLAQMRPELFEERDQGRAGWMSRLQKLGAKRLRGLKKHFKSRREKFTDQDVIAYSRMKVGELQSGVPNAFSYSTSSKLISASREADKILDSLVPKK